MFDDQPQPDSPDDEQPKPPHRPVRNSIFVFFILLMSIGILRALFQWTPFTSFIFGIGAIVTWFAVIAYEIDSLVLIRFTKNEPLSRAIGFTLALLIVIWPYWYLKRTYDQRAIVDGLRHRNCVVNYHYHHNSSFPDYVPLWIKNHLGVDFVYSPREISGRGDSSTFFTDNDVYRLRQFTHLKKLRLNGGFSDNGLHYLKNMTDLEDLHLTSEYITDAGLIHLDSMHDLENLTLNNCDIKGWGFKYISGARKLQYLNLSGCKLTDEGLIHFPRLRRLRYIEFGAFRSSREIASDLKKKCSRELYILSWPVTNR